MVPVVLKVQEELHNIPWSVNKMYEYCYLINYIEYIYKYKNYKLPLTGVTAPAVFQLILSGKFVR